ncbi:MAG: hypothetical protein M3277_07895 [Actinomycetota bacterium]|nr:hypothetical protein [Actinomycetota bacterium]
MRPGTREIVAVPFFVASALLSIAALGISLSRHNPNFRDEWGLPGFEGVLALSFASVGFIVMKRSSNPIGWIFTWMGFLSGVQYLVEEYGQAGLIPGSRLPGAIEVAWVAEWIWVPLIAGIGLLLLIFPDEQLRLRRDRVILGAIAITGFGAFVSTAFLAPMIQTFLVPNPFAMNNDTSLYDTIFNLTVSSMMLSIVAAAGSLFVRLIRSQGVRRQQLKWFSYAAVFASISLVFGAIPATSEVGSKFAVGGLIMISVACGVAILRYRLYDIDVIINRTLVYGALTAALLACYLLIVVTLSRVLDPVTRDSDIAVAASTLAVAALFRPLRTRVQGFIDRRFYRSKYDAARSLDAFGARLRHEIDVDAVRTDVLGVVGETLQPRHASIWIPPEVSP